MNLLRHSLSPDTRLCARARGAKHSPLTWDKEILGFRGSVITRGCY